MSMLPSRVERTRMACEPVGLGCSCGPRVLAMPDAIAPGGFHVASRSSPHPSDRSPAAAGRGPPRRQTLVVAAPPARRPPPRHRGSARTSSLDVSPRRRSTAAASGALTRLSILEPDRAPSTEHRRGTDTQPRTRAYRTAPNDAHHRHALAPERHLGLVGGLQPTGDREHDGSAFPGGVVIRQRRSRSRLGSPLAFLAAQRVRRAVRSSRSCGGTTDPTYIEPVRVVQRDEVSDGRGPGVRRTERGPDPSTWMSNVQVPELHRWRGSPECCGGS